MITKIENALNRNQLEILLNMAKDIPRKRVHGDEEARRQKNTVFDNSTWPGSHHVSVIDRAFIKETIWSSDAGNNLSATTAEKVTCGELNPIFNTVARYHQDDYYDWHLDLLSTGHGTVVNIAFTIFLNDPCEYDGGEFEIKHEHGVSLFKEPAGTILFYPTGYLHRVNTITSGHRFVSLGLLDCLVSSPQDRYILTEMSDCISSLNDISQSLDNTATDTTILDDINHRLHAIQMRLTSRYSNR